MTAFSTAPNTNISISISISISMNHEYSISIDFFGISCWYYGVCQMQKAIRVEGI
jgi:hypothetical protein